MWLWVQTANESGCSEATTKQQDYTFGLQTATDTYYE